MLVKSLKTVFVHIPKTAGQSIEDAILGELGHDRITNGATFLLKRNRNPELGPPRLAHLSAHNYVDFGYLTWEEWKAYFSFSFVRNPWARTVSLYKHKGFHSVTSFETFVNRYLPGYIERENWFFKPQTSFVFSDSDEPLVDFIGKVENLKEDFNTVATRLQLGSIELDRKNAAKPQKFLSRKTASLLLRHPLLALRLQPFATQYMKYSDYYSKKTKATVQSVYERDIDLLKYSFSE
jgi:hypothetical protein